VRAWEDSGMRHLRLWFDRTCIARTTRSRCRRTTHRFAESVDDSTYCTFGMVVQAHVVDVLAFGSAYESILVALLPNSFGGGTAFRQSACGNERGAGARRAGATAGGLRAARRAIRVAESAPLLVCSEKEPDVGRSLRAVGGRVRSFRYSQRTLCRPGLSLASLVGLGPYRGMVASAAVAVGHLGEVMRCRSDRRRDHFVRGQ
jgi:hypothetical protein